jgi:hypothetical protein
MNGELNITSRRWFPYVFAIAAGAAAFVTNRTGDLHTQIRDFFAVMVPLGGLFIFLYAQHQKDAEVFFRQFEQFNRRYDSMNEMLARIVDKCGTQESIDKEDEPPLVDYFNLCAEEYLFWKGGYIDKRVWDAWRNGMRFYAEVPAIREFWLKELTSRSYYGFTLKQL